MTDYRSISTKKINDVLDDFFEGTSEEDLSETPPAGNVVPTAGDHKKSLNLIFVVDVSGSMEGTSIAAVNNAINTIIRTQKNEEKLDNVIKIAIIEFSDRARCEMARPIPLRDFSFTELKTEPWITNYGPAFHLLNEKLSRTEFMDPDLSEYYAPIVLFITDGKPCDLAEYPIELEKLKNNGWFRIALKVGIAVGEKAHNSKVRNILMEFAGKETNVRYADEGEKLCELIEFVTVRGSQIQTAVQSRPVHNDNTPGGDVEVFPDKDPHFWSDDVGMASI